MKQRIHIQREQYMREKNTSGRILRAAIAAVTLAGAAGLSQGATLYWDGDATGAVGNPPTTGVGGLTGNWDASSNWWNGTSYQAWTGTGGQDIATFTGTAGTVTVNSTVNANQINISTTGYQITGGTINLTGARTFSVFNSTVFATVASQITGSGGLTKTGSGVLTLTNSGNTYSGGTTISLNYLLVTSDGALGYLPTSPSTNITMANGAFFGLQTSGGSVAIDANRTILINGNVMFTTGSASGQVGQTLTLNGKITGPGGNAISLSRNILHLL